MATEVVVVVMQTRCDDEMFIHDAARDAPNYGDRVPVDTTPGPVPVYKALKSHPISSSPPWAHQPRDVTATVTSEPLGICHCTTTGT